MSEISKYVCNDCDKVSWTTPEKGCRKCESKNLRVFTNADTHLDPRNISSNSPNLTPEEQKQLLSEEDSKTRKEIAGCVLIPIGLLLLGFLTGFVTITTEGCGIPFDIVLGDYCLLASFGLSLGASLAATVGVAILVGILGFILKLIFGSSK